jgi:hypothetical protein
VTNNFPMALPRKGVTIGITVNLDNYENLRVEVSGEAADAAEARGLVEFLDQLLAGLGRGDNATALRIDNYRNRVLSPAAPGGECRAGVCPLPEGPAGTIPEGRDRPPAAVPPVPAAKPASVQSAPGSGKESPAAASIATPGTGSPAVVDMSRKGSAATSPEGAGVTPAAAPPAAGPSSPEPVPEGGMQCETCGVMITPTEKKMSQLFTNRVLCKRCMKKAG